GQGGMGVVFLAEHTLIHRRVAVKILHPELATDADVVKRFMNEARAAGTLGHPNIVESTDMGFTSNRVPYIVFEYLEGTLLTDEIYRVGGLPVRRAVRIAQQITSALHAAHNARIVHRDLKSDNIFLAARDDTLDHVKVLDFGISRFLSTDVEQTRRSIVMGTPEFMAPEQISAPERVDLRADVYALGVILYEMLTARRPFSNDEDPRALLHRIVYSDPPPLQRPEVPRALEELVTKLLAKSPDDRYQSMSDVGAVLAGVTTQGATPQPRITRQVPTIGSDQPPTVASEPPGEPPREQPSKPPSEPPSEPPGGQSPASAVETPSPVSHASSRAATLLPRNPRHWLPVAIAGGGLAVGLLGLLFGLHGGGSVESAATAPIPAEPIKPPPSPPVPPDRLPDKVPISLDADVPGARVTFRRRVLAAPTTAKVTPHDVVELVEVSASGYRTVRYWLTFDRATRLVVRLTRGTGIVEATEEETLIALGEIAPPTPAAAPSSATPRAAVAARTEPAPDGILVATQASRPAGAPRAIAPPAAAEEGEPRRTTPRRIGLAHAESTTDPTEIRALALDAMAEPLPSEPRKVEPPAAQPSKAESPRILPKIELPKTEPPKIELPKTEPPKTEPPKTEPPIDPAVVTAVIGRYCPEVLKCVAQANKKPRGTLTLQLQVEPTGAVKHVQISSTLNNPPVAACTAKAAQKWKFPARPAGQIAIVNYPFVFN
ncbi:MAG: AgmX/PglI C-terminal domain-containing protein, partial [Deltaproteobacteria bacterium]